MAEVSDAQLFRIARALAKHESDIARLFTELQKEKRAAAATKRDVKIVKATTGINTPLGTIKANRAGLNLFGLGIRGGGFTLSGGVMRGAQGGLMVLGAAHAAGAIAKEVREFNKVQEKYGTQEASGRVAKRIPRSVAKLFFDTAAEAFGAILGATDDVITDTKITLRNAIRRAPFFGDSPAQQAEHQAKLKAASEDASRTATAFIDEQFTKPIKANALAASAYVRTSREAAAIMARLNENNKGQEIRTYKAIYDHSMRENVEALD